MGKRKKITQNTGESHADRREGICQIRCSAESYAGWDSMISTSSGNHSALAGEVSRPLNAAGAVEERPARHSFKPACECPLSQNH